MKVAFPYPGYERIAPVEVPDENLSGVYVPCAIEGVDEEAVLARGFAEPYGAPCLRDAVRPADRVLVLVDDATRGAPVPRLLKRVIGERNLGQALGLIKMGAPTHPIFFGLLLGTFVWRAAFWEAGARINWWYLLADASDRLHRFRDAPARLRPADGRAVRRPL